MKINEITEGTRCWKGYKKKGMKTMFGKRVPNCVKNESEINEFQKGSFDDDKPKRPSKGKLVTKDGTPVTLPFRTQDFRGDEIVIVDYIPPHKPDSTGRIVTDDGMTYFPSVADLKIIGHQFDVDENLRAWFGKGKKGGAGGGGWDRYNTKGERIGKCGDRKPGEGKPKCLSKSKAASLRAKGGKKAIGAAVSKKRRKDPNKNRRGKAKNVSNTKGK